MFQRAIEQSWLGYNPEWAARVYGWCSVLVKQNKSDRGRPLLGVTREEHRVLLQEGMRKNKFHTHPRFDGHLLKTGDDSGTAVGILKKRRFQQTDTVVIIENN